ncbi:MAG: 3-methyl-2-oxobutanoate hydroxymethyltransferase [Desulfovibrio sp.]|jgi:3-methyl-2-oxobutanoate hydroxymethyltransferase|nr:3-methyl-2-oxobutanoate hydroxymethyltransferase [Desulfovibrio sp.]
MSVYGIPQAKQETQEPAVTTATIRAAKGQRKIAMVTAYDYASALMVDAAGVDIVLVGDSFGMVMLGRPDTISVTLEEVIHHARAVVAGVRRALVVSDMPFMTYEGGPAQAMENAARLLRASGVRAVKIEGGNIVAPQVKALVEAGIPVMGHIGLTPQRAAVLGGFKVQGKTAAADRILEEDALTLQEAGCFSLLLEAMPPAVAEIVSASLRIPTIGIGAGASCDGQVLVLHDMLGLLEGHLPRFVKQYAHLAAEGREAVARYVREVREGTFPAAEHCYSMPEEEERILRGK